MGVAGASYEALENAQPQTDEGTAGQSLTWSCIRTILLVGGHEHHLRTQAPHVLEGVRLQCATEGADHPDYLLRLSELELIDRHHRMVDRRIKAARFPTTKSLDTFDFLSMPSLNKALVLELARCEYIERPHNVIVVGNSGTGKTHIALGLGLAAERGASLPPPP